MKSKKFTAVALSAALVLSGAYVTVAGRSGVTVSAASMKVKDEIPYYERYTTSLKINNTRTSGTDFYNLYFDRMFNNGENYGNGEYLTFKALKRMLADSGNPLPDDYPDTQISEFKGWGYGSNEGTALKDSDLVYDSEGNPIRIADYYDNWQIIKEDTIQLQRLYAIYTPFKNDAEADAKAKANAEAAAEKEEVKNRNASLDRRLWQNSSGNNVKYWWMDTVKDDNGNPVKDESGNTVYERIEGVKTAWPRAVLMTGKENKFTTANYSKNKDAEGGYDTEGHTYKRMTEKIYNDVLKAAKIDDPDHELFLVYDVHFSTWDNVIGLINGKQAQVKLSVTNYDLSLYNATVYHMVYGKDKYTPVKVKTLDIGPHDVTFYASDFSPYLLRLTPKDAVSGAAAVDEESNPSTGDVSALPLALLTAAALAATGAVAYKKRRAH